MAGPKGRTRQPPPGPQFFRFDIRNVAVSGVGAPRTSYELRVPPPTMGNPGSATESTIMVTNCVTENCVKFCLDPARIHTIVAVHLRSLVARSSRIILDYAANEI